MWINLAFVLKDIMYLGVIILLSYLFYKERKELLNRIMANSYEQYEYYQKMFKGEVEELKKERDAVREETNEDAEIKRELDLEHGTEQEFVDGMDEDWAEGEVDLPELRRIRTRKK